MKTATEPSGTLPDVAQRGGGITEWSYRVRFRQAEAKKMILAAFRAVEGNAQRAAEHLEVPHRTMMSYIKMLDLKAEIDVIRDEAGFPRRDRKDLR